MGQRALHSKRKPQTTQQLGARYFLRSLSNLPRKENICFPTQPAPSPPPAMKPFFSLLAIALAHLSVASFAQDTSVTVDLGALKTEFMQWKASAAGQEAYASGFVPSSSKESISLFSDEPTAEELQRFQSAKERIAKVQKEQPKAVFSLETPFTLLTEDEFAAFAKKGNYQAFRKLTEERISTQGGSNITSLLDLDTKVDKASTSRNLEAEAQQGWVVDTDWQTKGCTTRIKNQGACGSCTMFAVTAALESGYCIAKGKLYELSEQDVVSCRTGSFACDGASNPDSFDWITRLNGGSICTEASYPYASGNGVAPKCRRYEDPNFKCDKPNLGAKLYGGGVFYDHKDLEAVVRRQPVAVGMAIGNRLFQDYKGGVVMGDQSVCKAGSEDHAVLIVGFGTLDGIPFWKIKNQWGTAWGDNGWLYLERGYQGHEFGACGIESYAHYPIFVDDSNPVVNKRCGSARYGVELTGTPKALSVGVRKAEHCCDTYRQDSDCKGYNWIPFSGFCILLSTIDGEKKNAEMYAATILSKSDDMKKVSFTNNVDYPGNDLVPAAAATAEDCGDMCNRYPACNAFTWSKFAGGMCYLKSGQPSNLKYTDPSPDGTPYLRSGLTYKCQDFQFNVEFSGAPLTTVAGNYVDCCRLCRATSRCAAFSWKFVSGGTCYLQTAGYSAATNSNAISGTV